MAVLLLPSDDVREAAAKWLGYEETALSTCALAKYLSLHAGESNNNSLAEAHRGIMRNYDFRQAGRILRRFEGDRSGSLLADYFDCHMRRLLYSPVTGRIKTSHLWAIQNQPL